MREPIDTEVEILIDKIIFDKNGVIYFSGNINGHFVEKKWDAGIKDFSKIWPEGIKEENLIDEYNLFNGTLDEYMNLHWLVKVNKNIEHRRVWLEPIIKEALIEKYHGNY